MSYKVFVINPGSTSTKIALFEDDKKLFQKNVDHDAEELKKFKEIRDQLPFRMETILDSLAEAGISLEGVDAFSARGGGMVGCVGGVYAINDKLLEDAREGKNVRHPSLLGPQIAWALQEKYGGQMFCVNPPDVDELDDEERITGLAGCFRTSRGHPLNQKENCIRYANSLGKKYEDMNLICCHIGGGITVGAHRKGKYCSVNDAVNGDGPMAPTRAGALIAMDVVKLCFSGKYTEREMYDRITKNGGLTDHLGTSDVRDVVAMINAGDKDAKLVYDGFILQIAKAVGSCAVALKGQVDGIILTGGASNEKYLVQKLVSYIDWIAPISVQPGEFEMEALASGAIRAMKGEEDVVVYTGIPVFENFDYLKN